MARKKRSTKKHPTSRRSPGKRLKKPNRWRSALSLSIFGILLAIVFYGLYLEQLVQTKFEGKRWALPAQVFSRPLELYVGAKLTTSQLVSELQRLGYRKTTHPTSPGQYSVNRQRILFRSREFTFWDGMEASRFVDIQFSSQYIQLLKSAATGEDIPLMRLEPVRIGSIYPAHNEDRILIQRKDLPDQLIKALITVEDRSFYTHFGVDPKAIARALWANIKAGNVVQGGSTLTQQLVKNFFLTRERTLVRKLNEAAMALLVDAKFDKEDILEAYCNEIYLGQDGKRAIHGFGLASHFYFNRPLNELDLPRLALLIGLVRGPSYYDPHRHPERATNRRNLVLRMMQQQGIITQAQADKATQSDFGVTLGKKQQQRTSYPAFIDLVRRQLRRDYRPQDLNSEGLQIFTTLDPVIQEVTEKAVTTRLGKLEKAHGLPAESLESAAVITNVDNGEILALVGGRDPGYAGFNRALDAIRPIGSLVKPAVYLTALSRPRSYTLVTPLLDKALKLKQKDEVYWQPQNYDGKEHGTVSLAQALTHSYNLATVHLGLDLGLEQVADSLMLLGVRRKISAYPSMLLGAVSLSPLEAAQVYQTLASGGFKAPLRAIREVTDIDGQPLSQYGLQVEQVFDPGPVYLLNSVLQDVVQEGTAKSLDWILPKGLQVAGKTGTTDDLRDSWFAGFTGRHSAVVWIGRDDNKPAGLTGASGAMRVWGDIIRRLDSESLNLRMPESVELVWIDNNNFLLADETCEKAIEVPFIRGSAPTESSGCRSTVKSFLRRLFE